MALAEKREKPISQIAADLELSESVLRHWMQAQGSARTSVRVFLGHCHLLDTELAHLCKENKALRNANEILKNSAHLCTRKTSAKFIRTNRKLYTIREMTGLRDKPRSELQIEQDRGLKSA